MTLQRASSRVEYVTATDPRTPTRHITCRHCHGQGELPGQSISPFSGVPVDDPQCSYPCPRCEGEGSLGVLERAA